MKQAISKIKESLVPIYSSRETDAMVRIIFEHLLNYSRVDIIMHKDNELSDFMRSKIDKVIERLVAREPIQYVFNDAYFHGHHFKVTPATLIPRPETEELVDMISDENKREDLRVLDIGTGSGCIAISLALYLPFSQVSAVDISADAIEVAKRNAAKLKAKVNFIQADILNSFPEEKFDIIVSNPPYICEEEKADMEQNVLDFEPHTALFVPDTDPLLFYRSIAKNAIKALNPGGKLYYEINSRFAAETVKMLEDTGFSDIGIRKDMYNRNRFAVAKKPEDAEQ